MILHSIPWKTIRIGKTVIRRLSKNISRTFLYPIVTWFLVFSPPVVTLAEQSNWKPIDPTDIALKGPTVDKDADAEAIFWEMEVEDHEDHAILSHYVRIKIFSERGRDAQSKIDLSFAGKNKIEDIRGRTIKADGGILELNPSTVFERTLARAKGLKVQSKSFVLPGVDPGSIIEYRWREHRHHLPYLLRLSLQRNIPVQNIHCRLKVDSTLQSALKIQHFNTSQIPWQRDNKGFFCASLANLPAFREEPRMPPEAQVSPWLLIYYTGSVIGPERIWEQYNKSIYDKYKIKADKNLSKAAAEIIAEASTPDQKLERLFEYCRSKIKNLTDDASGLSTEEFSKLKENKSPSDTLRRGLGTGLDIDLLFAWLAASAGFEARFAQLGDRSDIFFTHSKHLPYFLRSHNIAVRVGENWRFFDPASLHVPYGMLRWQEEGLEAMISDPVHPIFVTTPLSLPDKSLKKRTAAFRLSEDGTLEGDVSVEYSGHCAAESKEFYDADSEAQRKQTLTDLVKKDLTIAELSNVRIEGFTTPSKPFSYSYHARVPGYAPRTGKRLFLEPAFFQYRGSPLFPNSERKYDVYFHYPWTEEDDVSIELPNGFFLDNPEIPGRVAAGKDCNYEVKMSLTNNGRTLRYRRSFSFGGNGQILISAGNYSRLKLIFDKIYENDNHTVILKQAAMASSLSK